MAQQVQVLQIMTKDSDFKNQKKIIKDLNNICDECKKKDLTVSQNLILTGFKLCKSCYISRTIFPL